MPPQARLDVIEVRCGDWTRDPFLRFVESRYLYAGGGADLPLPGAAPRPPPTLDCDPGPSGP
jgi:hypothetical protein